MNPEFVPFRVHKTNGAGSSTHPRSEIPPAAEQAVPFKPITPEGPHCAVASTARGEPQITLEREGERVTRIKVQCPCGNVIELACEY